MVEVGHVRKGTAARPNGTAGMIGEADDGRRSGTNGAHASAHDPRDGPRAGGAGPLVDAFDEGTGPPAQQGATAKTELGDGELAWASAIEVRAIDVGTGRGSTVWTTSRSG